MKCPGLLLALIAFTFGCSTKGEQKQSSEFVQAQTLKEKFKGDFLIGAAINRNQINGTDKTALEVLNREFNTITPENIMKWMYIHPEPDSFELNLSDQYVKLGDENNFFVVGHTLVWHSQLAPWVHSITDSAEMASHLKNHIHNIAGRYKGRIDSWDVVNEALNEDGTLRESIFLKTIGENYIDLAFKEAATADPEAQLVYNDYNLWKPKKRAGVVKLVKQLQSNETKIDGVGMQAHWGLTEPSIEDIENSILAYSSLGVKVMLSELDVTVLPNPWDLEGAEVGQDYKKYEGDPLLNPYPKQLPESIQEQLARRYEDIFRLLLKHENKISRVTFWGMGDGQSWLNNWPIRGRTNYPLLFDKNFSPKKAYDRVISLK
ncbi:MAG: endo-1,4-beta-xylanase [Cyclobacteriaceae bacterium]